MKRGSSGLSLVVGVDKPPEMSSHDVVSAARRIFGEKRVGHAGTLDPFASGVLLILVGPAARLDKYLTSHDKEYIADIAFGYSTDTDDPTGEVLHTCDDRRKLEQLLDAEFAMHELGKIVGDSMQLPPVYSAIKRGGKKAYEEARKGNIIELDPRPITVHSAELLDIIDDEDSVIWRVKLAVSKGTYIRSIARDLGHAVGIPAHLSALRRVRSGNLTIENCVTLEQLEQDGVDACLDPLKILGIRFVFADEKVASRVENGGSFSADNLQIFEMIPMAQADLSSCLPQVKKSDKPMENGELVGIVMENRLKAIYVFDAENKMLKPDCVMNVGVQRG